MSGGRVDLNTFRPSMDSQGFITVNSSDALGDGELSFGLVTNWGRNLLVFENGDKTFEVQNVISPTLVGAYGASILGVGLELGLSMPMSIVSGDRSPDSDNDTPGIPNDDRSYRFTGQGLGDLGLHAKVQLMQPTQSRNLGLAVIGSVYLPTASGSDRWLGEDSVTPQIMGVLDRRFGRQGRLRLALTGGVRLRTGNSEIVDDFAGQSDRNMPLTGGRMEAGPTLPVGAAISYALSPQRFDVIGEVTGAIPLTGENYFPMEAVGGIKVYLAENSFLTLGGGTGLIPGKAANPDLRAFIGIVFEPRRSDTDADGKRDKHDQCPNEAEDLDGFEDQDGCPDSDNDGDGILDIEDQCPDEAEDIDGHADMDGCPETDADNDGVRDEDDKCPMKAEDINGFEDDDGCPDRKRVIVGSSMIRILDKVHFEYDSAVIKPESFPILQEVAKTMKDHSEIVLVEVQGHTDQRGTDAYNQRLSDARAESVKRFLVEQGVAAERFAPRGYGESRLVDARNNEQAWYQNRRVEFVIKEKEPGSGL